MGTLAHCTVRWRTVSDSQETSATMETDMALMLEHTRNKILERVRALQRAIELNLPPEIIRHVRGQVHNYCYAAKLLKEELLR